MRLGLLRAVATICCLPLLAVAGIDVRRAERALVRVCVPYANRP